MEEEKKQTSEQIIKTLFKEKDSYQTANQNDRKVFTDIYAAYVGEMSDVKDRSKSQEKITKLRTEVNYIVPQVFSGNPELEVEKVGIEDEDLANIAEKIANHRLQTIPNIYEKIESWVKQSVVFGTSIISVFWRFETEKKKGIGMDGQPYEYEEPVKDCPDVQVPNVLDIFYNPIISEIEGQNSMIFRTILSVHEVRENEAYNYKENGKLNRELVESRGTAESNAYDSNQQISSDKIDLQKSAEGTVEIYERVTCDRIQTVCVGKKTLVLRDVEHEYEEITSVKLVHEPNAIPNRFNGYGVGHNTLGLGRLYQKMMNRSLDNVALTNNPFFIAKKGAVTNKQQLVVKVGGMLEIDDDQKPLNESVQAVQFPDIKQGALALMNKIEDEHKRASGANDLLQGAASNKTLGQDQLASSYSSNRFELINRRFKKALGELGRILVKMEIMNIQSIDAPILKIFPLEAEVVDGKVQYSRETVYQMLLIARENGLYDFNFIVKGETNVARNKDVMLKQLVEWYNMFGEILPPENKLKIAKKWLQLRGIDDAGDLVPDELPMQQMPVNQMNPGVEMPISQTNG